MTTLLAVPSETVRALPAGWRIACVGDILKIRNGYAFKSTDYKETGVPLIRQSELKSDVIDLSEAKRVDPGFLEELSGFIVREDDLLIGMSGSLGKIAEYQNKEPALQNQRTGLLIMKSGYDAKFARLVLKLVEPQIVAEGKGVAVQNVSAKEIEACTFLLPPANEQRRIVAEIEQHFTRLDAGVAALRRTQANLKRYRAAVLKAACEGRLVPSEAELARENARVLGSTPTGDFDSPSHVSNSQSLKRGSTPRGGTNGVQEVVSSNLTSPTNYETGEALLARIVTERRQNWKGRGTYNEPARIDDTKLGPVPEGWAWATVEHLADIGSGNTPPKITEHIQSVGPIPWFKVGDMNRPGNEQVMRSSESYLTPESADALGMKLFPAGSIIFPKRGGAIATNKKRLLEAPAATDLNVMSLTPHPDVFGYFKKWFVSIDLASLSDGSNVPQVNNKDIQPLLVPLPPLAEQMRIVAEVERRLSVIDELESVVKANLQRATRLRQSILQRAFSTELAIQ